jgi:hypothetical protein
MEFLRLVRIVLSSFFGVRKRASHEADFANVNFVCCRSWPCSWQWSSARSYSALCTWSWTRRAQCRASDSRFAALAAQPGCYWRVWLNSNGLITLALNINQIDACTAGSSRISARAPIAPSILTLQGCPKLIRTQF